MPIWRSGGRLPCAARPSCVCWGLAPLGRLGETLRGEGFYQAKLDTRLTPQEDTRQMGVTAHIMPGARACMGAIEIRNHTEFPDKELLRPSKLSPGREVTSATLDRAAERVRKFLVAAEHLGARIEIRRGEYSLASNALPLFLEVTAAPKVRVEMTGAKIRAKQLRKLLPIYAEGA